MSLIRICQLEREHFYGLGKLWVFNREANHR
jgi:hypothetical protein